MISRLNGNLDGLMLRLGLGKDLDVVLRGAGLTLLIQIAASGLNYGSQVFFARWLGPFEFGIYVLAWSLVPPLAVAAAVGLGNSAVRFVPQYLSTNRWSEIRGFIRHSEVTTLSVGTAMVAVSWLALLVFGPRLAEYYIEPVRWAVLCIPLLATIMLLSGLSRGFGWVGLAFVPQTLLLPGLLLVGVASVTWVVDQPKASQVLLVAVGVCAATALWHAVRFHSAVSGRASVSTTAYETRSWLRVAIPLFLSEGVFLVFWSADAVMLGGMKGPEDVAIFQACVKTAGLTLLFFNAITALAEPRFAALLHEHDAAHQQQFARSISRWMFFPTLVMVLALIALGPYVLATFGPSFVQGQAALIVLALGYLTKATTGPVSAYLAVSGNQNVVMVVTAAAGVTNIVGNLLLIPRFGVLGAAVSSLISVLLYQASQYVLVRLRLGVDTFFLARS